MKGKISVKTIIVLVVLVVVGVLSVFGVKTAKTYLSGAASGAEPKNVVGTPSADGKSATVSWSSDKASMGVVEYGTTPASLLLRAVETEAVVDHKVTLTPLKSGVSYYFRIRVGEDVFDNNGIPFSFKTASDGSATSVGVTQPLVTAPSSNGGPQVVDTTLPAVGCNRTTDYNKDGVINSIDMIYCQKNDLARSGNGTQTATASSNGVGSTTAATSNGTSQCQAGVDYNKDGTINSFDIIKCRQGSR